MLYYRLTSFTTSLFSAFGRPTTFITTRRPLDLSHDLNQRDSSRRSFGPRFLHLLSNVLYHH